MPKHCSESKRDSGNNRRLSSNRWWSRQTPRAKRRFSGNKKSASQPEVKEFKNPRIQEFKNNQQSSAEVRIAAFLDSWILGFLDSWILEFLSSWGKCSDGVPNQVSSGLRSLRTGVFFVQRRGDKKFFSTNHYRAFRVCRSRVV